MRGLFTLFREARGPIVAAALLSVLAGLATSAVIVSLHALLANPEHPDIAIRVGLAIVLMFVATTASRVLLVRLSLRAVQQLSMRMSERLLAAPLKRLEELGPARVTALYTEDVDGVAGGVLQLPTLLSSLSILFVCFSYLAFRSLPLLAVLIAALLTTMLSVRAIARAAHRRDVRAREFADAALEHMRHIAQGNKELKLSRAKLAHFLEHELAAALKQPIAATIQLLVREMDDRTVLEEAWVENLQRVDVGAREEAEGFQAMLDLRDDAGEAVYSIRSLAVKFGKPTSFVASRLKLQHVPEEMWAAREAGKIGLRQMELVGSLPDEAARKKAASMVLEPRYRTKEEPLTVRETVDLLKAEFMVSLRGCEWDLKDATLVAMKRDKSGKRIFGGACEDCPFRAGSDPDLQESLSSSDGKRGKQGVDAKTCLLPTCYGAKQGAAWKRTMKEASEKGSKVLTEEEAKKVFASWGSGGVISHSTELVSLSESPGYYETGHHAGADTLAAWGAMIDVSKVDPKDITVGRSAHTGKVHVLLKREKAIELAEAGLGKKGKDSPFANRPGVGGQGPSVTGDDDDEDVETDRSSSGGSPSEWQLKRDRMNKLAAAVSGKLSETADLQKSPSEDLMTELILGTLWEDIAYTGNGLMKLLKDRGVPEFDADQGDDDEHARAYLDAVIRPEIARAPYAWAALALYEIYDQLICLDTPAQSEPLLRAMGLDREAIVAAEDPQEDEEDLDEDGDGEG